MLRRTQLDWHKSPVVHRAIAHKTEPPWKAFYCIRRIRSLLPPHVLLLLGTKGSNRVVKALAKVTGSSMAEQTFLAASQTPPLLCVLGGLINIIAGATIVAFRLPPFIWSHVFYSFEFWACRALTHSSL